MLRMQPNSIHPVYSMTLYSRYEENLLEAKNFGIKKSVTTNVAMGLTQFIIFGAYALAFWYGTKLSLDEPENYTIGRVITVSLEMFWTYFSFWLKLRFGQVQLIVNRFFSVWWLAHFLWVKELQTWRALPWRGVLPTRSTKLLTWYKTSVCSLQSHFLSFNLVFCLFWMISLLFQPRPIDSSSKEGHRPDSVKGDIEFKNIYFNYPSRKDVKVELNIPLALKNFHQIFRLLSTPRSIGYHVPLMQCSSKGSWVKDDRFRFYWPTSEMSKDIWCDT